MYLSPCIVSHDEERVPSLSSKFESSVCASSVRDGRWPEEDGDMDILAHIFKGKRDSLPRRTNVETTCTQSESL
jgi:hypothetical protein